MITIRKLLSLKPGTRLRKTAVLLQAAETEYRGGRYPETAYLTDLLGTISADVSLPRSVREGALQVARSLPKTSPDFIIRSLNAVRHGILSHLGTEPADWDLFESFHEDQEHESVRKVFPLRVYLDDIRSPFNVGSIFRTAECFGVEKIFLSEAAPLPTHVRALRTSMGASRIVPYEVAPLSALSDCRNVFALETGGVGIQDFSFPANGTVIVGSEELGVSPEGRKRADAGAGRVSIPLVGLKGSLNVSVAFGILMHAWVSRVTGAAPCRFPVR